MGKDTKTGNINVRDLPKMAKSYIEALLISSAIAAVAFAFAFLFDYACKHFRSDNGWKKWLTEPWVVALVTFVAIFSVSLVLTYFELQKKARYLVAQKTLTIQESQGSPRSRPV